MTRRVDDKESFQRLGRAGRSGVLTEFAAYLRESKKWWMVPILLTMLALGLLVLLSSTPIAPFIYTLF